MSKQIKELPEVTTPATTDWYLMQKSSNDQTSKISGTNLIPPASINGDRLSSYKVVRDNNGSSLTENTAKILTGWGWIQNTTGIGQSQMGETVTFPSAFTDAPIVLVTYGGDSINLPAVLGTGAGVAFGAAQVKASAITNTNFYFTLTSGTAVPNTYCIYYHWIAIGI